MNDRTFVGVCAGPQVHLQVSVVYLPDDFGWPAALQSVSG